MRGQEHQCNSIPGQRNSLHVGGWSPAKNVSLVLGGDLSFSYPFLGCLCNQSQLSLAVLQQRMHLAWIDTSCAKVRATNMGFILLSTEQGVTTFVSCIHFSLWLPGIGLVLQDVLMWYILKQHRGIWATSSLGPAHTNPMDHTSILAPRPTLGSLQPWF